jgi:hypothetical protein
VVSYSIVILTPAVAGKGVTQKPVNPDIYPAGPCVASDALTLIDAMPKAPKHAAALIDTRILECRLIIQGYFQACVTKVAVTPHAVFAAKARRLGAAATRTADALADATPVMQI